MSKRKLITLGCCLLLVLCIFAGCSKKTPQTAQGFTDIMEKAGFTVEPIQHDGISCTPEALVASNDNYQLEFYNINDAEHVFSSLKRQFDDAHSTRNLSLSVSTNTYDYYCFNAGGEFHMIARIENTLLYCEADAQYRDEIVDLVKELGYK